MTQSHPDKELADLDALGDALEKMIQLITKLKHAARQWDLE